MYIQIHKNKGCFHFIPRVGYLWGTRRNEVPRIDSLTKEHCDSDYSPSKDCVSNPPTFRLSSSNSFCVSPYSDVSYNLHIQFDRTEHNVPFSDRKYDIFSLFCRRDTIWLFCLNIGTPFSAPELGQTIFGFAG